MRTKIKDAFIYKATGSLCTLRQSSALYPAKLIAAGLETYFGVQVHKAIHEQYSRLRTAWNAYPVLITSFAWVLHQPNENTIRIVPWYSPSKELRGKKYDDNSVYG